MYRQYENPHTLEAQLTEAKQRLAENPYDEDLVNEVPNSTNALTLLGKTTNTTKIMLTNPMTKISTTARIPLIPSFVSLAL